MPRSLHLPVILAVLGIAIFLWFAFVTPYQPTKFRPPGETSSSAPKNMTPPPGGTAVTRPGRPALVDTTNSDPRFIRFTDGTIHLLQSIEHSRRLHQSPDPREDLEVVTRLLSAYRLVFKENPVGSENAEIVAQLLGDNPKKTFFIDPDLRALNGKGELLDRWGSAFVFHPLKSDLMDIRSLGPDHKLWTDDDLSLDVRETEIELGLGAGQ